MSMCSFARLFYRGEALFERVSAEAGTNGRILQPEIRFGLLGRQECGVPTAMFSPYLNRTQVKGRRLGDTENSGLVEGICEANR
jgi:hypothetical protein